MTVRPRLFRNTRRVTRSSSASRNVYRLVAKPSTTSWDPLLYGSRAASTLRIERVETWSSRGGWESLESYEFSVFVRPRSVVRFSFVVWPCLPHPSSCNERLRTTRNEKNLCHRLLLLILLILLLLLLLLRAVANFSPDGCGSPRVSSRDPCPRNWTPPLSPGAPTRDHRERRTKE